MNETLARIVVNCACFFEMADEKTIDPGLALQQLEEMKWQLQKLSVDEKAELVRLIRSFGKQISVGSRSEEQRRCIDNLPKAFNLIDA